MTIDGNENRSLNFISMFFSNHKQMFIEIMLKGGNDYVFHHEWIQINILTYTVSIKCMIGDWQGNGVAEVGP